jgi:hypothetical protein
VLIGGCCFTESADIVSAFPWRASARWCSLAAAASRKAPTSCRPFLGGPPPAGAHWRLLLHGKHRHRVGLSLAGLRPLVLIGGILPPGGSEAGASWLHAKLGRRASPLSGKKPVLRSPKRELRETTFSDPRHASPRLVPRASRRSLPLPASEKCRWPRLIRSLRTAQLVCYTAGFMTPTR